MLIGLGHKMRVGKDTVADILVKKHGFIQLSFAKALKNMALEVDPVIFSVPAVNVGGGHGRLAHLVATEGWDNAKRYPEVRRFLQALGVSARNILDEDIWVQTVLGQLAEGTGANWGPDVVITDVRFPNEVEAIANADKYEGLYNGKLVRVDRPNLPTVGSNNHESETALDGFDGWDYVLVNDGLLTALPRKVDDMLIELRRPKEPAKDGDA